MSLISIDKGLPPSGARGEHRAFEVTYLLRQTAQVIATSLKDAENKIRGRLQGTEMVLLEIRDTCATASTS